MSYDSPIDGLSRPRHSLPTPLTKMARSSFTSGVLIEDLDQKMDPATLQAFQELLQASTDANNGQQLLIKEERSVEKTAEFLLALNQPTYITWRASYKVYKQKKGIRRMVELIDSSLQEFCAVFICELSLEEFLILENSDFTSILDKHFNIQDANNYENTLSALYMEVKEFSRADIENYCTNFLGTLLKNPTFTNPDCGGADEEIINQMFLTGLQTSHFRKRFQKFNTKKVNATYSAITKTLPKHQ